MTDGSGGSVVEEPIQPTTPKPPTRYRLICTLKIRGELITVGKVKTIVAVELVSIENLFK